MFDAFAHPANKCSGNVRWIKCTCTHRLGAVSSTDTHHCYVQYTVTKQLQEDKIPNLAPHAFTIASADNLDCSQPHATVYSGDQSCSCMAWYHQPKTQSLQNLHHILTSDHDYIVTRCRFASGHKQQLSDPDGDPSLKKKCRRARTLTEGPHPTSELLLSSRASTPVQALHPLSWSYPELEGKSIDTFKPSSSEKAAFDSFTTAAMKAQKCITLGVITAQY